MTRVSQEIGSRTEKLLKEYLQELSFHDFGIIPRNLSLMKSGTQYGFDLSWSICFSQEGTQFKWFFEAKSRGMTKYKDTGKTDVFKLSYISDKLLQVLSSWSYEIDCWCLFIPYLRLDERDRKEIKELQKIFPFNLIIWDKQFCESVMQLTPDFYRTLYPEEDRKVANKKQVRIFRNDLLLNFKRDSMYGKFLKKIHKEYSHIRADIEQKCRKEMFFSKKIEAVRHKDQTRYISRFYFIVDKIKFYIDKSYLDEAIGNPKNIAPKMLDIDRVETYPSPPVREVNVDKVIEHEILLLILKKALDKNKRSLFRYFKELVNEKDVIFLYVSVKHKYPDYNMLSFLRVDSALYFDCSEEKPVIFDHTKDYQ